MDFSQLESQELRTSRSGGTGQTGVMGQAGDLTEPVHADDTVEGEVVLVDDVDNSSSEQEEVDESAV